MTGNRIFWIDAKLNSISSCNYDGSNKIVVLHSLEFLKHPFSISIFEDSVYWSDWHTQTIFRANKFNGSSVETMLSSSLQRPMTVKIYHPYKQPDSVNHCQVINGHCSHLCLPKPKKNFSSSQFTCTCPDGMMLLSDNLMCTNKGLCNNFSVNVFK